MKYLKLFEGWKIKSKRSITDLVGEDRYTKSLKHFDCSGEKLTTLDGIEKFINLEYLDCGTNSINTLLYLKNLTKLKRLDCYDNNLTNLEGIENLKDLEHLECFANHLVDLDEIKYLPKLKTLYYGNNYYFKYPLPYEIIEKFGNQYSTNNILRFNMYECQKEFTDLYPERAHDLFSIKGIEIHKEIKDKFPALARGTEWGFFDLERSEQ